MSFGVGNNGASPFGNNPTASLMPQSNNGPDLEEIQTEVGLSSKLGQGRGLIYA